VTVRELIDALLDYDMGLPVYVGKGMGPLARAEGSDGLGGVYVLLSPTPVSGHGPETVTHG